LGAEVDRTGVEDASKRIRLGVSDKWHVDLA
jgi:hypothetical protein